MIEPGVWCGKCTQGCPSLPVYLSTLTLQARTSPLLNILIDSRPKEMLGDETLCRLNAGMRQGMKGTENWSAKLVRNDRTLYTCGNVT